ncbi:retrovirus-related pol polyprotein from transposon 297 [Plakobranchus ocellatus]|uniref:Retrovirus-related pol polyprotein from transposon 297 n=1 Tax=Plakobranchus ocellatus TaxID=259542 RepID=A0AAV4ARH4_9GAST|nr:retrovirus-related pol polyprotein from transposon 297 [Plakobranchus ocellatus]
MEVERLAKVGAQNLNLSGEELRKWIDEMMERDREDKEAELNRKRESNRLLTEEKEIKEAQKVFDRETMEKKLQILEKEAELLRLRPEEAGPNTVRTPAGQAKAPKLPEYKEGKDDMESYLLRFERFATTNGWPRANWAVHLSALLSAKALDTYGRLSDHESTDYDVVKRALLKRYNLTSEGFNVRFRSSRPEIGERIGQFKTRLETYLERWLELSERDKSSVEDWRDLILYEQIINACGRELRTFLKERNPKRCSELVILAEQYIEAHACSPGHDVTVMPVAPGRVNGKKCTVLRDSGCSSVIVKRGLVTSAEPRTGTQLVAFADGSTKRVPTTIVFLDCPYYKGSVEAALLDEPLYDVILGNINGVKCPGIQVHDKTISQDAAAVKTRARVLVRHFKSPKVKHGDVIKQMVVPANLRGKVMSLAHDTSLAGHLAEESKVETQIPVATARVLHCSVPTVVTEAERADEMGNPESMGMPPSIPLETPALIRTETTDNVDVYEALSTAKRKEAQLRAFPNLKAALTSQQVLKLPDFRKPFILSTDASDTGLGAMLKQEHDGQTFPVTYLSRKLFPRERKYSVVERECLALVWAVKSLNSYLWGREFVIETDHVPLLYLNKVKSENGRLMRWALLLSQYRFQLRSVKGRDNHGPDFLSRK